MIPEILLVVAGDGIEIMCLIQPFSDAFQERGISCGFISIIMVKEAEIQFVFFKLIGIVYILFAFRRNIRSN